MSRKTRGYYVIFDAATNAVLAIGRSANCAKVLFDIGRNPWDGRELACSFFCEPQPLPVHNLAGRENDRIGNFVEQSGTVPAYRFRKGI